MELASLSDPALVPRAVASALKVREQPTRPLMETLVEDLLSRQMLMVLDNCEHQIEACARLMQTVLMSCPSVFFLATSREPLGVAGEVNWVVPSLSVPEPEKALTIEELSEYGRRGVWSGLLHAGSSQAPA